MTSGLCLDSIFIRCCFEPFLTVGTYEKDQEVVVSMCREDSLWTTLAAVESADFCRFRKTGANVTKDVIAVGHFNGGLMIMLFAGMVWGVNVYVIRVLSTGGGCTWIWSLFERAVILFI